MCLFFLHFFPMLTHLVHKGLGLGLGLGLELGLGLGLYRRVRVRVSIGFQMVAHF